MAQKIIWAHEALTDLQAIAEFISKDSESYASALVQETLQVSESLADFPLRGRVVPELKDTAIREVFVENYRLIYMVKASTVAILALIHDRRDLPALWKKQKRTY
ncbi:MAG: type II toxin-antitoxin system RelE/ParE family toxin [Elusimicrobiota bacterium]